MAQDGAIEEGEGSPLHDLTGFQRDLLLAVAGLGDPHGLAVKDALDEAYNDLNHGRLYPNMDALVEKGLIAKGKYDDRTNKYSLTERGRRELEDHRAWVDDCLG